MSWPLVGRDEELKLISAAMDDPESGGVALVGPPGVGKSRLGRQALGLASLRGLPTVTVRASRSAAPIPFAALAPLFTSLAVNVDGELEASPFLAVSAALEERGENSRLVIVVDDAQDLDQSSAALLDQVVGRRGTFVIVTVRAGAEAGGVLEMWRDQRILRIQVDPLPAADVATLLSVALGAPVDGAALVALSAASGGNALYLRELVQGALESGSLTSSRGIWRLTGSLVDSPRLRDLIEFRFQGLTEAEREVVELVALGEPLALPLLDRLTPSEVVEALERRNILDAVVDGAGRTEVRLGHPLYGEVVRAHLSPVGRSRLCRRLADALEGSEARAPRDLLRLALWRIDTGDAAPELALDAARMALHSADFDLAVKLARVAWDDSRLCEAAMVLADALDGSGSTTEVERVLRAAYEEATTDADRVGVATRLASSLFVWQGRASDAEALLSELAATVTDPVHLSAISAQRANHFLLGGEVNRTIELVGPIVDVAEGAAFGQASRDYGVALALAGETGRALDYTGQALAAQGGVDEDELVSIAGIFFAARVVALGEAGRLEEAAAIAQHGYVASVERHNIDGQAWFACVLGLTLLTQGKVASATHLFRETASAFHELGHPGYRWGLGGMALASGQCGDRDTALSAIADLDVLEPSPFRLMDVHVGRGRAWAAVAAGDIPSARSTLAGAVELALSWGQLGSAAAALHDLVRIGETSAAQQLDEVAGSLDGPLAAARVAFGRAQARRDADLAAEAGQAFAACGAVLFAAECAALERHLAMRDGHERRASAAAHRLAGLLAQCEGARTPALMTTEPAVHLSTREREVALLAAEGLTSREIGERMFLSPRTVENHLQRVYVKLGVAGRTELSERVAALSGPRPSVA